MTTFAKEYEQYIISGFREESLNTLTPGGEAEAYFNLARTISQIEKEFPKNVKNYIKIFSCMRT
jgi:hypothetical protein